MAWANTDRWMQVALATAVVVGCAESHEPITAVEYCQEVFEIQCLSRRCCTLPSLRIDVSPEECVASRESPDALCASWNFDEDPRIAWDGSRAAALVEETRRAAESCTLPEPGVHEAMDWATEGLVEPGGPCAGPRSALVCRAGSYCHDETGLCVPYLEEGEACPRGTICADGLFCRTTEGVCARPGEVGGPCEGSEEAFDRECVAGLFCDLASLTCQPRIAIGEPCARWGEGSHDPCVVDTFCAVGTTQTCTVRAVEGGACDGHLTACGPELRCVDGTCLRVSPADLYYCN